MLDSRDESLNSFVQQSPLMHVNTHCRAVGSRQITAYLPRNGFHAGRHRVRCLMGIMGLQAIYKGPNTSKKHPQHRIYPYLLRKLPITRPNQVLLSGILRIPCRARGAV